MTLADCDIYLKLFDSLTWALLEILVMLVVSNKDTMNLIFVSSGEPHRWHNQGGDATERPTGKPSKGIFIFIKKQGALRKKSNCKYCVNFSTCLFVVMIFFVAFQVFTFDNVFPSDVKQVLSDFLDNHNYNRLVKDLIIKS